MACVFAYLIGTGEEIADQAVFSDTPALLRLPSRARVVKAPRQLASPNVRLKWRSNSWFSTHLLQQ
jgi:hypothetical protein